MMKQREQAANLSVQQEQEEQAAQSFTPNWNFSIINDDEEHYIQYKEYLENSSNAITPVLLTEEPEYSLSMGDDESISNEDVLMEDFKVYLNPLFDDDEIKSDKIDPHCFNDNPSFPRPPSEPPDVEFFFDLELDSGVLISAVMNNNDELNEDECFDPGGSWGEWGVVRVAGRVGSGESDRKWGRGVLQG
nr:hypothetical protein [Tanacetum cinerariifolium]